jgi:hypothetical protein
LCLGHLYSLADRQFGQESAIQFGRLQTPLRHQLKELRRQRLPRWRSQLKELRKKRSGQLLRRLPEPQPRLRPQFAKQKQERLLPLLQRLLQLEQGPLWPLQRR